MYMSVRFSRCCVRKRERIDQRTLVLASLSKNKYIERKNEKRRRLHLFPGNAMSLPRKRQKEEKKNIHTLTTMLSVNDQYRLMAN